MMLETEARHDKQRVQKQRTDREYRPRRWRGHFLWKSSFFCMSRCRCVA